MNPELRPPLVAIPSVRDTAALVQLNGDIFFFYNKSLGDLNVEKFTHQTPSKS